MRFLRYLNYILRVLHALVFIILTLNLLSISISLFIALFGANNTYADRLTESGLAALSFGAYLAVALSYVRVISGKNKTRLLAYIVSVISALTLVLAATFYWLPAILWNSEMLHVALLFLLAGTCIAGLAIEERNAPVNNK